MKFKINNYLLSLIILITALSCEKSDLIKFSSKSGVNFVDKKLEYSFLGNPEDEYLYEIPVNLLGDTINSNRKFRAEVIKEGTTAPDDQYELMDGTIKAGEFEGKLLLKLKNSAELKDTNYIVKLRLIETEDLNKGNVEFNELEVSWHNKIVLPRWNFIAYYFSKTKSTKAYQIFVEVTGLTEFWLTEYRFYGVAGATSLGYKYGDYIKEWNKNNPDNMLRHDDGEKAGELIEPKYYTHEKYD